MKFSGIRFWNKIPKTNFLEKKLFRKKFISKNKKFISKIILLLLFFFDKGVCFRYMILDYNSNKYYEIIKF